MKSNARCWTPPAAAPLIVTLLLTGCGMGGSDRQGQVCPPIVEYSTVDQVRAADEVEALPEGAIIVRMLSDYWVMRDQARICRST